MSFRHLLPALSIVCILAFVTTLLAQNRDTEDFGSELRKLRISYREALVKVVEFYEQKHMTSSISYSEYIDDLVKAQVALADLDAKLAETSAERIAALESTVALFKEQEAKFKSLTENGLATSEGVLKYTAARIHAEINVMEERERQARDK